MKLMFMLILPKQPKHASREGESVGPETFLAALSTQIAGRVILCHVDTALRL